MLSHSAFAERLLEFAGPRFAGPIAILRNWTFCLFYVMAELWGSVVVSVLFWGFANQVIYDMCRGVCTVYWDEGRLANIREYVHERLNASITALFCFSYFLYFWDFSYQSILVSSPYDHWSYCRCNVLNKWLLLQ